MQSEVHVRDWGLHENWLDRKQHGRIATSHLEVERISRMIGAENFGATTR